MTSPTPIRFGILGAGMVASYHREAILANEPDGARLTAVAHYDPSRFGSISADFGVPCVSEDDLLSSNDVDVVCICTPSGQHAAQAIAAARAGKHVLVEKPMALSLHDADRMIAACSDAAVQLGVVYQRRFDPAYRALQQAVASGDLGEPVLGMLSLPYYRDQAYYDSGAWRGTWTLDGGGVLINQGIHMIDVLVWFMGNPSDVDARATTHAHDIEVEDTLAATLRFPNGALASICATTAAAPGFPHRFELYGTSGGMQIEGEQLARWDSRKSDPPVALPDRESRDSDAGTGGDPRGIAPVGHVRAVADFMASVRTDRPPAVDGAEGRRSLAVVLELYRAAGLLIA